MNNEPSNCQKCHEPVGGGMLCPACGQIQPSVQMNHFTRLNIPRDFNLDIKKLEAAYFALQSVLHPDRFVRKSDEEKKLSMQHAMDINEAYDTMKSPLSRAEYLLKLEGIIVHSASAAIRPSHELLLENMEMREALCNAESRDEVENISITVAQMRSAVVDDIRRNFVEGRLADAAQNTIRLRYLEKLALDIRGKELRHEPVTDI